MNGMGAILKTNVYRSIERKNQIVIMLLASAAAILLAVFFTARMEVKGNIAVVSDSAQPFLSSKYLKVTVLDRVPPRSELVMNRYDAVVIDRGNGKFEISTIKSDALKKQLENFLANPGAAGFEKTGERGVGANILGFLIMFLLLQGMMFMLLYSDDKESRSFKRIASSPVSIGTYLFSHSIFDFLLIFIPTFAVLVICRELLGIDIGFSYVQYLWLLGLLALLSTSFALFMASAVDKADNCMTAGASAVTLTSILAGGFYSFRNDNAVMRGILSILPQRNYLDLAQGMEQGRALAGYLPQMAYLVLLPLLFFVLAAAISRWKFRQGRC